MAQFWRRGLLDAAGEVHRIPPDGSAAETETGESRPVARFDARVGIGLDGPHSAMIVAAAGSVDTDDASFDLDVPLVAIDW